FHVMKGENVLRKAGWDTHGLPVELEVEHALGLDGKPAIEAYGIGPFIEACKQSVWTYKSEWERMSERVGFWADMTEPYVTYHDNYIESVWWSLKTLHEKGLLYKGHKVVPYCPRCGTSLSSHEVAQGYKEVTDVSAYAAFKVTNQKNTYFLAWTTTPWTLPSNVALCVNAREDYCLLACGEKRYYLARALADTVFSGKDTSILQTMKGGELVGMAYEPLYRFAEPDKKAWYVTADDYVTLKEGTGIVHTAPAFGEDDARVAFAYGLPLIQLVDDRGCFIEPTPWAGDFVKDADPKILDDLKSRGLLFLTADVVHQYPFCWRCDTPLIYYARPSWFIRMSALREDLITNNRLIHWLPENIKEGRMGNFLENVLDWAISRERYWGTPLPIWVCDCGQMHVIGAKDELLQMAVTPPDNLELHRPFIDAVTLRCPACGGVMTRVKDVLDCWYDSGAMPFAQWHYPFENQDIFKQRFPADFISEAVDQTRGWFYTLEAISTALFGQAPFENCIVMGHVQDKDGIKMSKHKGNVIDPFDALNEHGADAVRWYFYSASPWIPSRFYSEAVAECRRKFLSTLQNVYAFFVMYANIDGFNPTEHPLDTAELTLMDEWILSRLHSLIQKVDDDLTRYRIPEPARAIAEFTDDLSNWYVRRCRERFWGKGMAGGKAAAFTTLYTVLTTLVKVIAPFVPFISESIYQNLVRTNDPDAPESVHLCSFPVCDASRINTDTERQMADLLVAAQLGRSARNLAGIKTRQPVSTLYVNGVEFEDTYAALLKDELNVKALIVTRDARLYTTYRLKPQMRTVGPKYGKLLGSIGEKLKTMDGNEAADAFESGQALRFALDGTEVTLNKEDVLMELTHKEGYIAQSARDVTAALDTRLTPELISEGYIREAVSKLQTMRREAGYDVTDRIHVRYRASDMLTEALAQGDKHISNSVLAASFTPGEPDENYYTKEWDL
ncbi:MAG: isoleucine--tRNA ligase, partial [Clostridia bacterium]|nr:isoleucine--tRNA ligase [Clostridia bacterium]